MTIVLSRTDRRRKGAFGSFGNPGGRVRSFEAVGPAGDENAL